MTNSPAKELLNRYKNFSEKARLKTLDEMDGDADKSDAPKADDKDAMMADIKKLKADMAKLMDGMKSEMNKMDKMGGDDADMKKCSGAMKGKMKEMLTILK